MAAQRNNRNEGSFRVYLVEDDAALGAALKFALEIEGFSVQLMDEAEPLLEAALPSEGACLVTDQNLPGVSGVELIEHLQRRRVAIPIILMSTRLPAGLRARAMAAGAAVVEKPILGRQLIDAIRALSRRGDP